MFYLINVSSHDYTMAVSKWFVGVLCLVSCVQSCLPYKSFGAGSYYKFMNIHICMNIFMIKYVSLYVLQAL